MATLLLDPAAPARATCDDSFGPEHCLPYAHKLQHDCPEYLPSLGMTAEQYASSLAEPGLTIEEAVRAGHMTAAEGRYVQGCATRDDLTALGYAPGEIEGVLEDQRARACASSARNRSNSD